MPELLRVQLFQIWREVLTRGVHDTNDALTACFHHKSPVHCGGQRLLDGIRSVLHSSEQSLRIHTDGGASPSKQSPPSLNVYPF